MLVKPRSAVNRVVFVRLAIYIACDVKIVDVLVYSADVLGTDTHNHRSGVRFHNGS